MKNHFLNAAVTICSNFELKMDIKYCIADDLDGKSNIWLTAIILKHVNFFCVPLFLHKI